MDLREAQELSEVLTKTISSKLQVFSSSANNEGLQQRAPFLSVSQGYSTHGSTSDANHIRLSTSPNSILGFKGVFKPEAQDVIPTYASLPTVPRVYSVEQS